MNNSSYYYQIIRSSFIDIISSKELIWRIFVKELNLRFRRSWLGWAWLLLPTALTTLLFVFLNKYKAYGVQQTILPYPIYVFSGFAFWQTFEQSANAPVKVIKENLALLSKSGISCEAILIANLATIAVDTLVRLGCLIALMLCFSIFPSILSIPFAFIPIAIAMIGGLGVGMIIAPFCCLYNDFERIFQFSLYYLFFLIPVFYTKPAEGLLSFISGINPLVILLDIFRAVFVELPNLSAIISLGLSLSLSLLLTIIGLIVYRSSLPYILERA